MRLQGLRPHTLSREARDLRSQHMPIVHVGPVRTSPVISPPLVLAPGWPIPIAWFCSARVSFADALLVLTTNTSRFALPLLSVVPVRALSHLSSVSDVSESESTLVATRMSDARLFRRSRGKLRVCPNTAWICSTSSSFAPTLHASWPTLTLHSAPT